MRWPWTSDEEGVAQAAAAEQDSARALQRSRSRRGGIEALLRRAGDARESADEAMARLPAPDYLNDQIRRSLAEGGRHR